MIRTVVVKEFKRTCDSIVQAAAQQAGIEALVDMLQTGFNAPNDGDNLMGALSVFDTHTSILVLFSWRPVLPFVLGKLNVYRFKTIAVKYVIIVMFQKWKIAFANGAPGPFKPELFLAIFQYGSTVDRTALIVQWVAWWFSRRNPFRLLMLKSFERLKWQCLSYLRVTPSFKLYWNGLWKFFAALQ